MEEKGKSGAIRLTNKTAIALRRNAGKVRRAWLAFGAVLSVARAALAVYLGMRHLVAVPITVAVTVLADAAIGLHARSCYLRLIGQAICTEAAAREMRERRSEGARLRQAARDLMDMKQDALSGETPRMAVKEQSDVLGVGAKPAAHRRRRQAGLTVVKGEQVP